MISSPIFESRLPVGSSARTISGLVHDGAGDGDALLLSAGQLVGARVLATGEAHRGERLARPQRALARADAGVDQRHGDVLEGRGAREQVELLEHEAEARVAQRGEDVAGAGPAPAAPRCGTRRRSGTSRQPRMLIVVDLPEPDAPGDGHELARADVEVHAVERVARRRRPGRRPWRRRAA